MDKIIKELQEYVNLSIDENGETSQLLIDLYNRKDFLSETFANKVRDEIIYHLNFYKINTEIIERTITRTETFKELEWNIYD